MTDVAATNHLLIHREGRGPAVQIRTSRGFEWNTLTLPLPEVAPALDNLRIFHLTDLHCRKWWDGAYDDLIAGLKAQPPDMILFTGDFVESKHDSRPALPTVKRLLAALPSRLGIFAIHGNHDGDLTGARLADTGVTFLDHRRLYLQSGDATVELIGLPGVDRFDFDRQWVSRLGPRQPGSLRIVMCHYPNILPRVADLAPDLYLTGHCHGGQVALPNGVPIMRHDTLPRRLCTGIHRAYGTVLVANRGFGFTTPLMLRMFCPAEVVTIVIKKEI